MDIDLDHFKNKLMALRQSLEEQKEEAEHSTDTVVLDQSRVGRLSRMDALQGQAMSEEAQRRRTLELTRVITAIGRIEEGEYGDCVSCGDEIALPRLEIDPAATQCLLCAEKSEHH